MPLPFDDLFDSQHADLQPVGSRAWNREVFERAYCVEKGPFETICQRLRLGFSVLVYLPGNCMAAAGELVKLKVGNRSDWIELGTTIGDGERGESGADRAETMAEVWGKSTSMAGRIKAWLKGNSQPPNVVFHNLDLLGDGRGGLEPSNEAKTAMFYLIQSVRTSVVLGLSDRDAGELPDVIRRPFAEEIWLDELSVERFKRIIPKELGRRLLQDEGVPDGMAWLIASRLRWTDPIRAVKIMASVARSVQTGDTLGVLQRIMEATRTMEFMRPDQIQSAEHDAPPAAPAPSDVALPAAPRGSPVPTGFEPETVKLLRDAIIGPFQSWATFLGNEEECQRQLRQLAPGIILYGPPGTGKTRLAKWIARSAALPVRQVRAADLKRPDYGQTERLVRELFRAARRAAPCIIVLDDADDLLPDRGTVQGSVASAEIGIVNAFLQEWQGFGRSLEGVLVILTTNRYHELDRAAKSRVPLHLHLRIPYPLDRGQVGEIVDTVARSYALSLSPGVREALVEQFFKPLTNTTIACEQPDQRRNLNENLYAPRDIESAMRLLVTGGSISLEEVEHMKASLLRAAAMSKIANHM